MTAPDLSSPLLSGTRAEAAMLRIRLDGPLGPDYLPLLAAREWGSAAVHGLTLALDEPGDDVDPFAALERGDCDLVLAGSLRLLEATTRAYEPLGCMLESEGGVLMRDDRLGKLRTGETVRVAASVRGETSDRLCRRIVQGWAGSQGFAMAETKIAVTASGSAPFDDLQAGYDAAWPVFANVEMISARSRERPVRLLRAKETGFPGFSRLELVASQRRSADDTSRHQALVAALEAATRRLQADPDGAVVLWRMTAAEADERADAIVRATVPCFKAPFDRNTARRRALQAELRDL